MREFPTVVIDEEFRKESLLKEVLVESNGQRVVVSDTLDLLKLTTDTCWIYFRLVNTTNSDQSLIFEPGNNKFEYFSLYCNMNSEPTFLFGADDNEMSESSEINLSALDTCYFGVEVFNDHPTARLDPKITEEGVFQEQKYVSYFTSFLFYGALLFVFILSIILLFYFRRNYIGWYAFYVLCFGLFLINYEGLLDPFLYQTGRSLTHKVSISLVFLSYMFNILFLTTFLKIKERFSVLHLVSRFFIFALLLFAVFNLSTPVNEFFRHYVMIVALLSMSLIFSIIVICVIKKSSEARLILFSYFWLMFFGFLTTQIEFANNRYGLDGNILMKIGLLGEVIMLTLVVILVLFKENDSLREMLRLELNKSQEANVLLEEKQDELTKLSTIKDRFLVNISHELRTPLNAILGTTTILKSQKLPSDAISYLDIIRKAGGDLMHVIDDILSIKILTKDEVVIDNEEFDLVAKAEELVRVYKDKAIEKRLYFDFENALFNDHRIYRGDSIKLIKAVSVILDNALKYTHDGAINLSIIAQNIDEKTDQIKFVVTDTGIGIREEGQKHVFEVFSQDFDDYDRTYGGAGVGLTIFQKIVDKLGGEIIFSSKEGEGSMFGFTVNLDRVVQEKPHEILDKGKVLNILVVEDDEVNMFIAKQLLAKMPYEVNCLEATNGTEALEELQTHIVDLIFMDIQMPIMDGYEATENIRALADKDKSSIPIIALTAHTQNSEKVKSKAVGMNDFITKPYTVDELIRVVKLYLNLP